MTIKRGCFLPRKRQFIKQYQQPTETGRLSYGLQRKAGKEGKDFLPAVSMLNSQFIDILILLSYSTK